MQYSPQFQRQFAFYARIIGISAVVGAVFARLLGTAGTATIGLLQGALMGMLIGGGCLLTQIALGVLVRHPVGRRLPLIGVIAFRSLGFGLSILIGLAAPIYLVSGVAYWRDPSFGVVFGISGIVAFGFALITEITRLLGKEATISLLTGRYRRPRIEPRIVMFADVIGSTALGERLGDLRFHAFLSDVAMELSKPVERARGDVHRYVGDAVIVTWPLSQEGSAEAAVHCARDMHTTLAAAAARFQARYNAVPELRIALHCGAVAAGEIGDWKKEIALLGDTMNTAARIEGAARSYGEQTVLSEAVANHLMPERRASLRPLPQFAARGKDDALDLWASD